MRVFAGTQKQQGNWDKKKRSRCCKDRLNQSSCSRKSRLIKQRTHKGRACLVRGDGQTLRRPVSDVRDDGYREGNDVPSRIQSDTTMGWVGRPCAVANACEQQRCWGGREAKIKKVDSEQDSTFSWVDNCRDAAPFSPRNRMLPLVRD